MGTSLGCVKFEDGLILFAAYQNTADVMESCLFYNMDDVFDSKPEDRECLCRNDEPVFMAADYGGGFHWSGRACRKCRVITKNSSPYPLEGYTTIAPGPDFYCDGLPEWWPDDEAEEKLT